MDFLDDELASLEAEGRRRRLRRREGPSGPWVRLDGDEVINFSANDYLGLAGDARGSQAACEAAAESGAGASASRLIAGNHVCHEGLEEVLASWQGAEAALLFNSGYQANVGVLSALAGRGDLICSDALNHASLIDGMRLSRADVAVYRHGDAAHAEEVLRAKGGEKRRRVFIVTDSLFSMDGDWAPLRGLRAVADRYGAALIVDEAHAVGVMGEGGRGMGAALGVGADVHIGTLGKAFGSFGAYVAGRRALRDVLLSRARSFLFTTGLPPYVASASRRLLDVVRGEEGDMLRGRLWEGIERVGRELGKMEALATGAGKGPIFPLLVGDERAAMEACEEFLRRGIYVQGIRPPTVPRGTSRLRVALMATHSEEDLERFLGAVRDLRGRGVVPTAAEVEGAFV